MSKVFAAVAVLLGLSAVSLLSIGASPHAHTITFTDGSGGYSVAKDEVLEIDYAFTTTFTVQNNSSDDLDFILDAGPNGRKCRVDFTPAGTKCDSALLTIAKGQARTFTATAKHMGTTDYSYVKFPILKRAWPWFVSDVLVAKSGERPKKIDPDLEIERDPPGVIKGLAILGSLLAGLTAWFTRRRT